MCKSNYKYKFSFYKRMTKQQPSINAIERSANEYRHWESNDFSMSKVVRVEGDMNYNSPRLGCSGQFEVEKGSISITGFEWDEIQSNLMLSSYYDNNCLIDKENASRENPSIVGNFRIGLGDTDLDRSLEELLQTCSLRFLIIRHVYKND